MRCTINGWKRTKVAGAAPARPFSLPLRPVPAASGLSGGPAVLLLPVVALSMRDLSQAVVPFPFF